MEDISESNFASVLEGSFYKSCINCMHHLNSCTLSMNEICSSDLANNRLWTYWVWNGLDITYLKQKVDDDDSDLEFDTNTGFLRYVDVYPHE